MHGDRHSQWPICLLSRSKSAQPSHAMANQSRPRKYRLPIVASFRKPCLGRRSYPIPVSHPKNQILNQFFDMPESSHYSKRHANFQQMPPSASKNSKKKETFGCTKHLVNCSKWRVYPSAVHIYRRAIYKAVKKCGCQTSRHEP